MEKKRFEVRRPDIGRLVMVLAASAEVAKAFVELKFPLVLTCPSCKVVDDFVVQREAKQFERISGLDEDGEYQTGEPFYDSYGDTQTACYSCHTAFKYERFEQIVNDCQQKRYEALMEHPSSYNIMLARREGWILADNDTHGVRIERYDEDSIWKTDDEAFGIVKALAEAGSAMHRDVLEFVNRQHEELEA